MSRLRLGRRALVLSAALLVCGISAVAAYGAFFDNSNAKSSSNALAAGTVVLTDSHTGSTALVGIANGVPTLSSDTGTGCINVSYTGSLSSNVHLWATVDNTGGLATYLTVTITRGTFSPSAPAYPSCTNFVADSTNYIGSGAGVLYSGTLLAMGTNYSTGTVDLSAVGTPATWSNGNSHVYKVVVVLQDNLAARSKSASATLTWEAQNT
jgi:hypothetical protein